MSEWFLIFAVIVAILIVIGILVLLYVVIVREKKKHMTIRLFDKILD